MIPYHSHATQPAFGEGPARIPLTAGDYGRLSGHRIVAEDHARAWIARAEQDRRLAEAGVHPPGIVALVVALREATGVALIQAREWLRGVPPTATDPASGDGSVA
ncbi:MAG: hypothetical protein M3Q03_14555 [Chloroflexota bacterium]|nr:hypothetical protein [Chloroflexota bacterium]